MATSNRKGTAFLLRCSHAEADQFRREAGLRQMSMNDFLRLAAATLCDPNSAVARKLQAQPR